MPRQPFEFKSETVGDNGQTMMVAKSIPNSSIVGPMFLPTLAHINLLDFVSSPVPDQALVVFGPPKSSKTTVLFEVLPNMVAARVGGLDPVFVRHSISLCDSPHLAALNIWHALARVARAFEVYDVDVPADATFDDARREIPLLIRDLAPRFESKASRQLWVLIDEVSVCLSLFVCDMFHCARSPVYLSAPSCVFRLPCCMPSPRRPRLSLRTC